MPPINKGYNPNLGREFMERYRGSVIGLKCLPNRKAAPADAPDLPPSSTETDRGDAAAAGSRTDAVPSLSSDRAASTGDETAAGGWSAMALKPASITVHLSA